MDEAINKTGTVSCANVGGDKASCVNVEEQLIKEIETTPISLLPEILHFVQSIKTKHPDVDFMEFAGMAADIENTMQEIVEEAEANRQLDLRRINDL